MTSLVIGLVICLLGITPLSIDTALAQVGPRGTFSATRTCEATQSIRRRQNPGNIRVLEGQRYEAVGFNSPERKFIYIKVPGASPERRWVSTTCGDFSQSQMSPELLPFFDTVDNPVAVDFPRGTQADITPPPPELNDFDLAVLEACGSFGSQVEESTFKALMLKYPDVLDKIEQSVDGEIFPGRGTQAEFTDDLTDIWFKRDGFQHIFCGEPSGSRIGGLHFAGRYLQLQQEGIGGVLPVEIGTEEIVPGVIYTVGVEIKDGNHNLKSRIKGYALVSNAEEMLVNGTKAFKAFEVTVSQNRACLYTVVDPQTNESFKAVFVKNNQGIRTFYGDATPNPNDPPCGD